MHVAVDLDGTIDAAPAVFQSLLAGLKAAGHVITVLTGASDKDTTGVNVKEIAANKKQYLDKLGLGEAYSQLVVLPQGKDVKATKAGDLDLHDLKADWLKSNNVDLFIDNDKGNARAAVKAGVTLVLVPWATRS